MAFQVSPGVEIKEIDATNVVPAVSTTIGGFAGAFNWGPADQVKLISSENGLVEEFGKPDNNTFKHFFVAASFLKYGNALKVVRTVGSDAKNAVAVDMLSMATLGECKDINAKSVDVTLLHKSKWS